MATDPLSREPLLPASSVEPSSPPRADGLSVRLIPAAPVAAERRFYRHRLPVRVMHWINVVCLFVLLMSGLTIFNAHPALYWGQGSDFDRPWLAIYAEPRGGASTGVVLLGGERFVTDGVLGSSRSAVSGERVARAFPEWATLPSGQWLSMGRHWHFFFAWIFVVNGVAYVLYTLFSRHLVRDLVPTAEEWRHIGGSIRDHLFFRHPHGEAAKRYNVLQNIAYLVVIFGLLPLIVFAGLAMSPRLDSVIPGWVGLLGGRQSARSLHFLAATGLLLFVLIHVFEVLVSGVWNQLRSMITGYYTLPPEPEEVPRP